MGRPLSHAGVSLWHDTAGDDDALPRPPLDADTSADVAVVGAGYTGLWTAYYLAQAGLDVVLLEAETAGFGASGRNGGWCSALFPASLETLARGAGRDAALAQHRAMVETIDEVERVTETEGIDAQLARGGTIALARTAPQLTRARAQVEHARSWGLGPDQVRLLDAEEAHTIAGSTSLLGATYTPHCAALHPARLAHGLAASVVRRGVRLYEQTRVRRLDAGVVTTDRGTVRAAHVVRATEGYTRDLAGERRTLAPIHSLVIATAPLPATVWDQIGLARRETFTDHRHLIIYGQRTADDRLVFGGRGAPYRLGSRIVDDFDPYRQVFDRLHETLVDLFPAAAGHPVTHRWGGALGVPRDWYASVGLDPTTGLAWAGGYVGDGVSTTNLAGRTLADLVCRRDTALTRLPWVGHRSRRWEPEPVRWLGINAGLRAMTWADAEEAHTGRPSRVARLVQPLLG